MERTNWRDWFYLILVGIAIISIWIAVWITLSHFEAQAYNRVTGKNVSTWDAMFIELRVQERAQ